VAQARADHPRLVGQVLVYPATDPTMTTGSYRTFVEGPFLARRDMEWFYDQYLGPTGDRADVRVDVARGLSSAATVPAVVFTVGHDPLRDEGIAYAEALREQGETVTWIHAPELFHGSFTQSGVLPSSAARVTEVWAAAQEMFTSPV
jgi:acetyl esterase